MIVVDTNLIAYLTIGGPHTATARKAHGKDHEWAAPTLWRSEYRNVLALYLRKQMVRLDDALRLAVEAEKLMIGREYLADSKDVLQLAERSKLSAYDCEFLALAQRLSVRLVTTDKEVLKAFPRLAIHPDDYVK